jgi:hypothetical protein
VAIDANPCRFRDPLVALRGIASETSNCLDLRRCCRTLLSVHTSYAVARRPPLSPHTDRSALRQARPRIISRSAVANIRDLELWTSGDPAGCGLIGSSARGRCSAQAGEGWLVAVLLWYTGAAKSTQGVGISDHRPAVILRAAQAAGQRLPSLTVAGLQGHPLTATASTQRASTLVCDLPLGRLMVCSSGVRLEEREHGSDVV